MTHSLISHNERQQWHTHWYPTTKDNNDIPADIPIDYCLLTCQSHFLGWGLELWMMNLIATHFLLHATTKSCIAVPQEPSTILLACTHTPAYSVIHTHTHTCTHRHACLQCTHTHTTAWQTPNTAFLLHSQGQQPRLSGSTSSFSLDAVLNISFSGGSEPWHRLSETWSYTHDRVIVNQYWILFT